MDLSNIPVHMHSGVKSYIEDGVPPASFLKAVLCNDLVGAFAHADDINTFAMREWADLLSNELPSGSWGSEAIVEAWIDKHESLRTTQAGG